MTRWRRSTSAVILAWATALGGLSSAAAQAKPEGEMRFAVYVTIAPAWLDAGETVPGNLTPFWFMYGLHDALVKPMPGNRMAPSLAESWSESPDRLVYEFKLRKGLKFHNGDPFTAEDVKFSFERAKGALLKQKVKEVVVADPSTVRFVLHEPWPDFMTIYGTLSTAAAWITPKNYFEKVGADGFKRQPIGLGPYKFVSMQPGIELVMEANEDYWRKVPSVKRLVFISVPDGTTRLAMLKRGEVDVSYLLEGDLDNPTFRGMRQSLMQSFEQIYLFDLHGSSLKKERCPDGSKDENVFDIQQGVAIGIFIKKAGLERKITYAELWGTRDLKYDWLQNNDVTTTKWTKIQPKSPSYFFIPRDEASLDRYQKYPKITEIFPVNSVGIVTSRDDFVIDFEKEDLNRRIRMFRDKNLADDTIREAFGLPDKQGWKLTTARKRVSEDKNWEEKTVHLLYRPFDVRWIFYHDDLVERARREVMRHMQRPNLGLITPKQFKEEPGAFVTEHVTGHKTVSAFDINYIFPLYCYSETGKKDLLSKLNDPEHRKPNLAPIVSQRLKDVYGPKLEPEDIFNYIYAVLYSNNYRARYVEFLKTDFPHVPFVKDRNLFKKVASIGQELVSLHLIKSNLFHEPVCRFQGKGNCRVEKKEYNADQKRVCINQTQYFEAVELEVWEYRVGGYQVLDQWLKDHRRRILSTEDIKYYCRVVTALAKTIEMQHELDELYPLIEKDVITIAS